MKKYFLTIAALCAISTSALAHNPHHPRPNRHHVVYFTKMLPNGVYRECRVEKHREPGRGIVRTQTCWRAR